MTGQSHDHDPLERVELSRRELIQKIVVGSAFAVPVIASFDMSSLGVSSAYANSSNQYPDNAPSFSTPDTAAFTVGRKGSFTVATPGSPPMVLTKTGTLPKGVKFAPILNNFDFEDNNSGTLSGTPAAGTAGTYEITFHVSNGIAPDATQVFTLVVDERPAFTGKHAATVRTGETAKIELATVGYPAATISASKLPPGMALTVDRMRGSALLHGKPPTSAVGVHKFTLTASNGVSPDATRTFVLTVHRHK